MAMSVLILCAIKPTYYYIKLDPNRESEQFQRIRKLSEQNGINPAYTSEIYRRIIDIVISRHQEIVVTK